MTSAYAGSKLVYNLIETTDFKALSEDTFDKFITKLITGQGRSVLANTRYYTTSNPDEILLKLVKKRVPTSKQFDKLLVCASKISTGSFEWVNHIIDKGLFTPTTKQTKQLIVAGYSKGLEKSIETDDCPSIEIVLGSKNIYNNLSTIEKIVKFKKLTLTNDNLKTIIDVIRKDIVIDKVSNILTLFIDLGFIPDNKTLQIVFEILDSKGLLYTEWLTILLSVPMQINGLCDIVKIICSRISIYSSTRYCTCIYKLIDMLLEHGYTPTVDIYTYILHCIHHTQYIAFLTKMVSTYGIKPDITTLIFACDQTNDILFNFCLNQKIFPDMECLYSLCNGMSPETNVQQTFNKMLEQIINTKILPDQKSVEIAVLAKKHKCVEFLLNNGACLNMELIELMIGTGYAINFNIPDLESYSIPYDEKIYKICHKYNTYPPNLIKLIKIDINIIRLREMCKTNKLEEITVFMDKNKLQLDNFCYDNLLSCSSVKDKRQFVLNAIENKLYYPDKSSIMRIETVYDRTQLFDKYIKTPVNHVHTVSTEAVEYKPEVHEPEVHEQEVHEPETIIVNSKSKKNAKKHKVSEGIQYI